MFISILGRQPEISIAELESLFSEVSWFSNNTALFSGVSPDVQRLGGSQKIGQVVAEFTTNDHTSLNKKITQYYLDKWGKSQSKITLGISFYDTEIVARDVQKLGLAIKSQLKRKNVSLRLVPNDQPALSTATSHHNKLGLSDNKVELLIARGKNGGFVVAESLGAQNITALARRDQGRPKRDAFVGMLPPKLAQIMINLSSATGISFEGAVARRASRTPRDGEATRKVYPENEMPVAQPVVLDPFCGTGVLLQEAALLGYSVYGTDLSEKMIRYSRDNLNWLIDSHKLDFQWYLHEGDATDTKWRQPIDLVVSETYLGQPFSSPPPREKLIEVRDNCNKIVSNFLKNLAPQIDPGTPICLAVPAWRLANGSLERLSVTKAENLTKLGYTRHDFKLVDASKLIYAREDQIVGRELLVIARS